VVTTGLSTKDGETGELLNLLQAETVEELRVLNEDFLKKAGLTELSEKLKDLQPNDRE
jgi:hypothetical protein